VKTGLSSLCLALVLGTASAALGAEPASPSTTPPGAEEPRAPSAIEPTAEAPPKQTASEREASTRDEHSPEPDSGGREFSDEKFGHGMQFGLRAGLVGGYRMVFRYDESPFCRTPDPAKVDKDQQKFCGHVAPLALDVALSFGVVDFAEPYAWARFGLKGEAETNTEALLAFGVGARIYTMSDSKFKIFVEPALGLETEGGAGNRDWAFDDGTTPEYKTDFLFHLAVGPQYDFARAFGIYLNAGLTTGVLRYIHTQLEVGIGAQVRVP
jgi:opacity protein-like surface antigen